MEGHNILNTTNNGIDEKLYVPRSFEGEKSEKFFEVLRFIEDELTAYPWFIGIAPYGSQTKGYSNEESDIDLYVFCDNTFTTSDSDIVAALRKNVKEKYHIELHLHTDTKDEKFIKHAFNEPGLAYAAGNIVKMFSGLAIGPGIEILRKDISEAFQSASAQTRQEILDETLKKIWGQESESAQKITERLTHDSHATQEIIEKRMQLWKKRLENLWGYPIK